MPAPALSITSTEASVRIKELKMRMRTLKERRRELQLARKRRLELRVVNAREDDSQDSESALDAAGGLGEADGTDKSLATVDVQIRRVQRQIADHLRLVGESLPRSRSRR